MNYNFAFKEEGQPIEEYEVGDYDRKYKVFISKVDGKTVINFYNYPVIELTLIGNNIEVFDYSGWGLG